jgi:hypothetical protein
MGRTGRRPGTSPTAPSSPPARPPRCRPPPSSQLHAEGLRRARRPSRRAFHILAHQILALAIQLEGAPAVDLWPGSARRHGMKAGRLRRHHGGGARRPVRHHARTRDPRRPGRPPVARPPGRDSSTAAATSPSSTPYSHPPPHHRASPTAMSSARSTPNSSRASTTTSGPELHPRRPRLAASSASSGAAASATFPAEHGGRTRWSGSPARSRPRSARSIRDVLRSDEISVLPGPPAPEGHAEQRGHMPSCATIRAPSSARAASCLVELRRRPHQHSCSPACSRPSSAARWSPATSPCKFEPCLAESQLASLQAEALLH